LYAYSQTRWFYYRSKIGLDLQVVIADSFVDAYIGIRNWNPEKDSFLDFLCDTVDSKVSKIIKKEIKKMPMGDDYRIGYEQSLENYSLKSSEIHPHLTQLQEGAEQALLYKETCDRFLEDVKSDPQLTIVLKLIIEWQDSKPEDIASQFGVSVEEVYNVKKRLARRLRKRMQELQAKGTRSAYLSDDEENPTIQGGIKK